MGTCKEEGTYTDVGDNWEGGSWGRSLNFDGILCVCVHSLIFFLDGINFTVDLFEARFFPLMFSSSIIVIVFVVMLAMFFVVFLSDIFI